MEVDVPEVDVSLPGTVTCVVELVFAHKTHSFYQVTVRSLDLRRDNWIEVFRILLSKAHLYPKRHLALVQFLDSEAE